MVFRVVTLEVVVRKQKISSFNIFQEHGHTLSWGNCWICIIYVTTLAKWIIFIFSENFFSLVKFRICLNIIVVFCITEHANLPILSTDKFDYLGHFANSAVCCRFLRLSPSNFASMIRTMPLFFLSIIRRISLIVLKEFRLFCDFKIFDVVKVLFWRNIAPT